MATVDTLLVRIEADMSDLKRELDKGVKAVDGASKQMASSTNTAAAGFTALGKAFSAAIVVTVGAGLLRVARAALDAAGDLGELADQVGLTTDSFQELVYAGSQVGVSQEQLSASLAIFSRNVGQAAEGNDQLLKTFRNLGVTVLDANGKLKSNDQVLNEVVDAIARIPDPARQTAVGFELFGRSFAKLLPMFKDGKVGLDALRQAAREAGVVLGKDSVEASDLASDKLKELELKWAKLAQTLASKVAPSLLEVLNLLDKLVSGPSVSQQIENLDAEIARLEALQSGPGAEARKRISPRIAAGDAARLEALRAQRDALKETLATPGTPSSSTSAGGTNPRSQSGQKMLDQLELQRRLAQVTGNSTAEIERQKLAIEARQKAIDAGLTGRDLEHAVALALATYDLTEAEKARVDGIESGKEHFIDSLNREMEMNQAKQDLIDKINDEISNNDRLLEAIKKGEKAYKTELALIQMINDAKQKKIDLTPEEIEAYKQLAETIGEQTDEIDRQKEKIDANKRASRDFANVIGKAFEDAVIQGKGLRGIMKGLEEDIARIILRMTVTKPLENSLTNLFGGSGGGSSGSSGGGFDLFGSIGSLFSSGGGSSAGGGDWFSGIGDWFGGLFAEGGSPPMGKTSIVGERGPELFVPKTPGTIVSNDNMKGMGGTYYIDARNADGAGLARLESTIRELNGSIEKRSVSAVLDHKRRNPAAFA